ncbi:hypothetical protein IGI37_002897 [Enterococcus sp. AZ194]
MNDANFKTKLSEELYWVPFNTLGKVTTGNNRVTLLDSLLFFQSINFKEFDDTLYINDSGLNWEFHRTGDIAFLSNSGCCSSTAGWACFELKNKFDEVGMLSLFRPNGTGHVFNYIYHKKKYYVFDFLPFTKNYGAKLIETGEKRSFIKNKYLTSICYETIDLNYFSRFFGRIQASKGFDHLFFQIKSYSSPPCSYIGDEYKVLIYPENHKIIKLSSYKEENMGFLRVPLKISDEIISSDYFY